MNKLLAGMKNEGLTDNGALKYNSTLNAVYDLFARGGAMRQASETDVRDLFIAAYNENAELAMKCLFYLRDILGGQGERRFFRICFGWLAEAHPEVVMKNMANLVYDGFGRWDDLFVLFDTPCEDAMIQLVQAQLVKDALALWKKDAPVSLLGKWMPSENASSSATKALADRFISAFGTSARNYRKSLAALRAHINVVERLMSAGKWDEIQFDKLPSRAGLQYMNAFREHCPERYAEFMASKTTTVNAGTLYPYDVVRKAREVSLGHHNRDAVNKYWDNLTDYFHGMTLNALAVVDTSGSMEWTRNGVAPIDVAIALGLYCAERAHGPFANHFISFSRNARLIECIGQDFVEKVDNIYEQNLCENTNLDSVFQLIFNIATRYNLAQEDLPEYLVIISDMQIDCSYYYGQPAHIMEKWRKLFQDAGYIMPKLIWWNVNAKNPTMLDDPTVSDVTYVSGCSPVVFEMVLSGKTGYDLMLDKLNSERYTGIHA